MALKSVPKVCSFPECGRKYHSHGYCRTHSNAYRAGKELKPVREIKMIHGLSLHQRFEHYVTFTMTCWQWTGYVSDYGYGIISIDGKLVPVHRYAYEFYFGRIPTKAEIDHRCRNRKCVNPMHLRLATRKQNNENVVARKSSKTGVRGVHPYGDRYIASLSHNYEKIYLGVYDTIEEASRVVSRKRRELHTHSEIDRNQVAMEEILFSGAGGSGYTKKSSDSGGSVPPKEGGKGRVTPPTARKRSKATSEDETAPRRRRARSEGEGQSNERRSSDEPSEFSRVQRRTTSRRGLAGSRGRRLRRSE